MEQKGQILLQAEKAFAELQKDEHLRPIVLYWGKCPLRPQRDYFRELCDSVLAQQISGKVARTMSERLVERLDGKVSPHAVAGLSLEEFRALGISRRKGETLLELARSCLEGEIPLDKLGDMSEEEIDQRLTRVKGIGHWTVMMFLIFSLNRPRVVPAEDFGIRKAIQKLYNLPQLPTANEVRQCFSAWAPHETVASWYLWRSLENSGRA